MTSRIFGTFVVAMGLAAFPAMSNAQEAPAQPDSATVERVQNLLGELQTLGARLEQLQAQAMQDGELSAEREALGQRIQTAMEEADPTLPQSMQRAQAIGAEAQAAVAANDQARVAQLEAEMQQIQGRFLAAQQAALESPAISGDYEAFQERLTAKLASLDPEAPALIARFEELQRQLAAELGGA